MSIKIVQGKAPRVVSPPTPTDPTWQHWMSESVYDREQARKELGLASGTFYRRIARPPTLIERLAMAALFEGLEPFGLDGDEKAR